MTKGSIVAMTNTIVAAGGLVAQPLHRTIIAQARRSWMGAAVSALMVCGAFGTGERAVAQIAAVSITSKYSVAETADRLEAAVKAEPGFSVFGRVDYQSISASRGGKIRPSRLVLFGRGGAVERLLTTAPTLGLDLPLKMLIWEAADGTVKVTYNTAEFLKERHSVEGRDKLLQQITARTALFAKKAAE